MRFLGLLLCVLGCDSFSLLRPHGSEVAVTVEPGPMQTLGAIALATILSFGVAPSMSHAAVVATVPPSSSLLVSETIKILDLSLPSYDAVKDAQASVETVKGLALEPEKEVRGEASQKRTFMAGTGDDDKASKKKEAAAAKAKAREEFEKESFGGKAVEVVDVALPKYEENTSQSQRSAFSL